MTIASFLPVFEAIRVRNAKKTGSIVGDFDFKFGELSILIFGPVSILATKSAIDGDPTALGAAIIFGIFPILFIHWIAHLLFNKISINVSRSGITSKSGLFGIGRLQYIPVKHILSIETYSSLSIGEQTFYSIKIFLKSGKIKMLDIRIDSLDLVNQIIGEIETKIRLNTEIVKEGNE